MELTGVTWIVAADGGEARVFVERAKSGEVRELPGERMAADDTDRPQGHQHRATVHQRAGDGRHGAGERSPSDEAERRFLKRVATRLGIAASRGEFDRLVLMAPPRALGVLRGALPPAVVSRIEAQDPHERKACDVAEIRLRLREARARA